MAILKKADVYASFGTAAFCGLLLLLLLLIAMPVPEVVEDEGVMVSLGLDDDGWGESAPSGLGTPQTLNATNAEPSPSYAPPSETTHITPQPQVRQTATHSDVVTQDAESAAAVETARQAKLEQDRVAREQERVRQEEIDRQKRQAVIEAERKAKADQARSLASGAFGGSGSASGTGGTGGRGPGGSGVSGPGGYGAGGTSSGQGTGSGSGIQGNPLGKGNAGGKSFSLGSRTLRSEFFEPVYNSNEEGRIVINISVDDAGNVTNASIAPGTNITDTRLRSETLAAARRIKFTTATGGPAMGTITYSFTLR